MRFKFFTFLLVLFFLFSSPHFAQTSPTESQAEIEKVKKELEKRVQKMLDEAVNDAGTLKLAQNRAIVYAIAGDLYWKFDEKRARELFRTSANDILVANAEGEKDKKDSDDPYADIFLSGNIRNEVLPLIAKHDADLALELLVQTRPAKLAEALARASQPTAKQDGSYMNFNPEQYRVRS